MVGHRRGSGENCRVHLLGMVAQRLQVSLLESAERPDVIELFDDEFIFSRGRTISLARRFSDVFASGDCFIVVGEVAAQLVSALVVRSFIWIEGDRQWRGAMIGLVCTKSQYRGNGYASELLAVAERRCRALGHDFAVLWTANHTIYKRLGWIAADRGTLGTCRTSLGGTSPDLPAAAFQTTTHRIHALHEARGSQRVKRRLANYQHMLPPVERLLFFLERSSYALSGEYRRTGYVYDLAGSNAHMPRLWDKLAGSFDNLYVNVERESAVHCWLQQRTPLVWKEQSLTMWKPLRSDPVPFGQWYIPFMDRI